MPDGGVEGCSLLRADLTSVYHDVSHLAHHIGYNRSKGMKVEMGISKGCSALTCEASHCPDLVYS